MKIVTKEYIENFDKKGLSFELEDLEFLQTLLEAGAKDRRQAILSNNLDRITLALGGAIQWSIAQIATEENASAAVTFASALGDVLYEISNLFLGDRVQNLEIVLIGYTALLTVYTRESNPVKWAKVQSNLATAYWQRNYGDRAANIEQAITGYQAALIVRQPYLFPLDCLTSASNLGNLAYEESDWPLALQAYDRAIEAMKIAITWSISDEKRQEILRNAITIYKRARESAFNLGRSEQSTNYVKDGQNFLNLSMIEGFYCNDRIPFVVQAYLNSRC